MTRDDILASMARDYRLHRRLELSLTRSPLNRQFKNPKCKSAEKLRKRRQAVLEDMAVLKGSIWTMWVRLPEVKNSPEMQMTGMAVRYAAELAKPKKRRPKYLREQQRFALPEEATVSPAGA